MSFLRALPPCRHDDEDGDDVQWSRPQYGRQELHHNGYSGDEQHLVDTHHFFVLP